MTKLTAAALLLLLAAAGLVLRIGTTRAAAGTTAQFWGGRLDHAIKYDESGREVVTATQVWTGSNGSGESSGANCYDWTTHSFFFTGTLGILDGLSSGSWQNANSASSDQTRRLYCISPERN